MLARIVKTQIKPPKTTIEAELVDNYQNVIVRSSEGNTGIILFDKKSSRFYVQWSNGNHGDFQARWRDIIDRLLNIDFELYLWQ